MSSADILDNLKGDISLLRGEIAKVIVGGNTVINLLCSALFAEGHILLEGVPGLGKTLMVSAFSKASGLSFSRVQFTPDLMPQDITGGEMLEESNGKREFRFIKGPVFANIILADEINRTPPKTQAALLEAMQERQVTASGKTYPLDSPFLVMATQNPIEHEGTYPLPEAQLDRFLFYVKLSYPTAEEEVSIASMSKPDINRIEAVLNTEKIREYISVVKEFPVSESIVKHAVDMVRRSRPDESANENIKRYVAYGAGPRGSQNLIRAAKAYSACMGKTVVSLDELYAVAEAVLTHRVILNFQAIAENITFSDVFGWLKS